MRIHRSHLATVMPFAVFCLARPAVSPATVILEADIPALRKLSDSVVHARVADIQSAWNAERSMIFTHVTLDVIRTLHGTHRDRIVVRVPSGSVDGFTVQMPGAPRFRAGNVVVFIGAWDDGTARVVGYFQGLSQVAPDRCGVLMLHEGAADGLSLPVLTERLRRAGP